MKKYYSTFKEKYQIGIDDPPHFAQSPNHLLSKNLVDLLEDSGVELKWIPEKHTEMFDKWNKLFLNNTLDEHQVFLKKTIFQIHTYPWEMYSSGKIKCHSGDEAFKKFNSDNRNFANLFIYCDCLGYDDWKEQVYEVSGNLSAEILEVIASEFGREVYVFNEKENWTLVYTHETYLGPYYYVGN